MIIYCYIIPHELRWRQKGFLNASPDRRQYYTSVCMCVWQWNANGRAIWFLLYYYFCFNTPTNCVRSEQLDCSLRDPTEAHLPLITQRPRHPLLYICIYFITYTSYPVTFFVFFLVLYRYACARHSILYIADPGISI